MEAATAIALVAAVVSPAFAAGGAYMAVRKELEYLGARIERNRIDIAEARAIHREDIKALHDKISDVERRHCST